MKHFCVAAVFLVTLAPVSGDEPAGYVPVAPAAALNTAVRANVKAVRKWLSEKDFISALDTMRSLTLAVDLYGCRCPEPAWRKKVAVLQDAAREVSEGIKRKSAADCEKALAEFDRLLAELDNEAPPEPKGPDKSFKVFGTSRSWMDLMQSTYLDARHADSAKEFEQLCQALAEEANVLGYVRKDGRWQADSEKVRDTALQAAKVAAGNDAAATKKALKEVFQRCEACHQRTRR